MQRRRTALLVGAALAVTLTAAQAAVATTGGDGRVWTVRDSAALRTAVERASSGDTIRLRAGVYRAAVVVQGKALHFRGAGEASTVVLPPLESEFAASACARTYEELSAFCFLEPDGPVSVRDLTTMEHGNGVVAVGAEEGIRVQRHTGVRHAEYGVAAFGSSDVRFTDNTEVGDEGEAGIYVGDTPDADARLARNVVTGWRYGFFLREARDGVVTGNTMQGNCVGALVLDHGIEGEGEEPSATPTVTVSPTASATATPSSTPTATATATRTPSPTPTATSTPSPTRSPSATPTRSPSATPTATTAPQEDVAAGEWDFVDNDVVDNDRACPAEDEDPAVSGHGIAIVGADSVVVLRNRITDHATTATSAATPSGVTVLSGEEFGADAAAEVTVERNVFARNRLDVFWDGQGEDVTVRRNVCSAGAATRDCRAPQT